MGGALAAAVCASCAPEKVILNDRAAEKAAALAAKLGCAVSKDNCEVARESQFIFLGVKPQFMGEMLSEISEVLEGRSDRFLLIHSIKPFLFPHCRRWQGT